MLAVGARVPIAAIDLFQRMNIIDTHAHLDAEEFAHDLEAVMERAARAGVGRIVCVGTSLESSRRCMELARRFPGRMLATAGIHPNCCAEANDGDFEQVAALAALPEVAAVGETGLDFHRDYAPAEMQVDCFLRHLRLARSVGKPLVIHARRADEDVLAILAREGAGVRGVRHCYDGTPGTAERYVELGMHVAFGGAATRSRHKKLKAAAASIPAERLLVETDCPYMRPAGAPEGPNEPANVRLVVGTLAELRGAGAEEIARITTRNAEELLLGGPSTLS
ncbi:MAG: TatD family hydrolase [Candidatus Brocadiia bacterium]|nr:TatD family hydrolase [Candidatus Brocadiia bacterium]